MLTHERELLSQLRRRDVWNRLHSAANGNGNGGHGSSPVVDAILRTTEAKTIYQGLKVFFSGGGVSPICERATLLRLSLPLAEDPDIARKEVGKIEDPHEEQLALHVVYKILAKFMILGHHERLLMEAKKNGGPEWAMLERQSHDIEELRRVLSMLPENGHGEAPRAPRLLHEWKASPDEPGDRLPTHLHSRLDEALGGGMRRKEVGLFVAPANHGKTAMLLRMATQAALSGRRVFYMTMEIYLDQIKERVQTISRKIPKTFYAEEYDSETMTPEEVAKIAEGVKPDLLIVDYLDLLKLDQLALIEAQGRAIRRLRNFAKKHECVVWTATQADEPYEDQMYLKRDQLYGSRQKLHASDFVVGGLYLPRRQVQTLSVWKSRHKAKAGMQLSHQVDFADMKWKEINV